MNNDKKDTKHKAAGQHPLLAAFNAQALLKREQGSNRTAKNYRSTIAKLKAYIAENADGKPTGLQHIDSSWVQLFASWLLRLHPNNHGTVNFYLSNFKAMYNRAIEQGETAYPAGGYPFAHVVIKAYEPFKRALPEQKMQQLSRPENAIQLTRACRQSLDLLLFTFFCQGINFNDVYTLTYDQIDAEGYIIYIRSKTGALLKVILTDEMKHILAQHRVVGCPYLFPFLHERRKEKKLGELNEDSSLKRTNRHLKIIGKLMGIKIPLTTYVMRHTFASLMLSSGASIELISQCLGHKSIKTTQIYLTKLTTEKLDKATDKMIEMYIREPKEEEKKPAPPKRTPKRTPKRKNGDKTVKPCQTTTIEEKKCPSLNKKRTFGGSLISNTSAKVIKTFYIIAQEWQSFFSTLHNITLLFTEKLFHKSVSLP